MAQANVDAWRMYNDNMSAMGSRCDVSSVSPLEKERCLLSAGATTSQNRIGA